MGHKPRGKKRPRSWHHGQHAGRIQAPLLAQFEAAERRAAEQQAELEELAVRGRDETAMWQDVGRAAPFVPRWIE